MDSPYAKESSVSVESTCSATPEVEADFAVAAARGTIYNMLTASEIDSVVSWMLINSGLNLVPYDDADLYQHNYITYVYLAEPVKAEALAYLATGKNRPGRFAHVHVSLANYQGTASMRQYFVGPIDGTMSLSEPLSFGGINTVPFDARQTSTKEYDHLDTLILDVMGQIESEMRDSYGTSYYAECPDDFCLTYSDTSPRGPKRDITLWFLFDVEAFFANPVGFYLTFSMGGRDTTKHRLKLIVYNGQSFPTIADFKSAYAAENGLIKLANRPLNQVLYNNLYGVDWASLVKAPNANGVHTGRGVRTRRNSNIAAPQVQEPGGKRFTVQDSHVDYLGWTFNIGHTPISGLKLYNVRYRGHRVAYEIGLSEAIAVYSGVHDLVQAATVYGDTAWGLGASANQMVRGIDCPSTGILQSVNFLWDAGETTTIDNTICIFENAGQTPLRRHSNGDSYGGLATHSLVVRIVLPVYNYDYVFDHVFHLNGAIELRSSTSGYLQSTFYSPEMDNETRNFGQRIGPFTAGTTHDHVLNFKIDMDVLGDRNSLVQTVTRAVKATPRDINGKAYQLSNFAVAKDYKTKIVKHNTIQTERGFTMDMEPTLYTVVAGSSKNRWGGRRGYRLKINGVVNNLVADTASLRAYSFSKHTLAATVRHEDESTVSSIYDQSDTTGNIFKSRNRGKPRPLVDLDRYLANKERLHKSDLVLWVNVGVHHHTHSEDIPVTTTNGNTVNIFLLPTNLWDYDDSMDLGNSVYAPAGGDLDRYDLKDQEGDLCPLAYAPLGEGYTFTPAEDE